MCLTRDDHIRCQHLVSPNHHLEMAFCLKACCWPARVLIKALWVKRCKIFSNLQIFWAEATYSAHKRVFCQNKIQRGNLPPFSRGMTALHSLFYFHLPCGLILWELLPETPGIPHVTLNMHRMSDTVQNCKSIPRRLLDVGHNSPSGEGDFTGKCTSLFC